VRAASFMTVIILYSYVFRLNYLVNYLNLAGVRLTFLFLFI